MEKKVKFGLTSIAHTNQKHDVKSTLTPKSRLQLLKILLLGWTNGNSRISWVYRNKMSEVLQILVSHHNGVLVNINPVNIARVPVHGYSINTATNTTKLVFDNFALN